MGGKYIESPREAARLSQTRLELVENVPIVSDASLLNTVTAKSANRFM